MASETRTDLLATAAGLAAAARSELTEGRPTGVGELRYGPDPERAAGLANAAKAALEAAQLADNTTVGEVNVALGQIHDLLEQAGVLTESMELDTTVFLDRTFQALLAWRQEALAMQGYQVACETLSETLESLESDFITAATPTSQRIAARIHTALENAGAIIARGQQGAPHGDDHP